MPAFIPTHQIPYIVFQDIEGPAGESRGKN